MLFEKMEIVIEEISKLTWSYYESLVEEGFSEEQALLLAAQFAGLHWQVILSGE